MVRPPEAESLGRADPGGGDRASLPRCPCPLGFYEAEFVRTRCENSFFLFLIHFGRRLATTHRLGFGA